MFELKRLLNVRLEDSVHLVIRVDLLHDLCDQDALDLLLHLLSALLQQGGVGVLLGLRVEGVFPQRDLDGRRGAAVAHAHQLLFEIVDAPSLLFGQLAGIETAVGVVVDLLLDAIAVAELVAGQAALAAPRLAVVVQRQSGGRRSRANRVHSFLSSLLLLSLQAVL